MDEEEIAGRKAMVLANKHDFPDCITTAEVTEKIGTINRKRKPELQLLVFSTSVKTEEGFMEICEWLYTETSREIENEEINNNLEKTEKSEKCELGFISKVTKKMKRLLID